MLESVLRRKAQRGGNFLDGVMPGWRSEFDPLKLDVGNGWKCPLAQLYGNFDKGRDVLGLSPIMSVRLGFMAGPIVSWFLGTRQAYRVLTHEWQRIYIRSPSIPLPT